LSAYADGNGTVHRRRYRRPRPGHGACGPAWAPLHRRGASAAGRDLHQPARGGHPSRLRRDTAARWQEIVRYSGLGAGAGLFGGLDRDALAAVGIDLDTVRARIESSFGPEALTRAGQAARPALHRLRVRAWLIRRLHRRREAAMAPIPLRAATGMWRSEPGSAVFLPFTRSVPEILRNIRHKARAQHDTSPDAEHIALAVLP
jgi:hypothetical protein